MPIRPSPLPPSPYAASRALAEGTLREGGGFWRDVLSLTPNIGRLIGVRVLLFGVYGFLVSLAHRYVDWAPSETRAVEFTGVFLTLLLAFRTNASYDRWWEARKLWGGIVNQTRNLVTVGLGHGPRDPAWRSRFVRLVAAFPHVSRRNLRGEHALPEIAELFDSQVEAARISAAPHMPSHVAQEITAMLRSAQQRGELEPMAFHLAEGQRIQLIDHIGGCERILRTRFPTVHRVMLSQFSLFYLLAFPFAVVTEGLWLEAALTMTVAFPLLALDQIARELGNPFSPRNLSHLPLDDITRGIENTLLGMLAEQPTIDERTNRDRPSPGDA